MSEPKEKRVELILQQLNQLPTLPAVAMRVLEVTGDEESSASQVVELIESDPSLTTKILQLVHRAELGVRGEVNTVERAVVMLGFDAVRSAVLAVSVFNAFGSVKEKDKAKFNREAFWRHSVAVAACAELLAVEAGLDSGEAFVCGLLHDLGKVALDVLLPKSFDRVVEAVDLLRGNIADLERTVIGLDHMVVGKRLAERWQLPTTVRECLWLHGQSPDALPATVKNPQMVNLITLADVIVREQHLGYSGNYTFPLSRSALLKAAGISEEQIKKIQEGLIEKLEQRARTLGLGVASSGELYLGALEQANQELGRMSEQLAAKNRRLAMRARFFDALANFQGELTPDAPPGEVLKAIGQTAAAILNASAVAAFSAQPGGSYAEMTVMNVEGDCIGTRVIDTPGALIKPLAGEGPILAAGPEMEWILAGVGPELDGDHQYWICLEAEGVCIGGVVWGGPAGEGQRLSPQTQELTALCSGWGLALRTAQIRDESRALSEQLAESNRKLQTANTELLRSRTLVSVGEMAAGAAHEMNNPLAVISGRSQLLASQLTDPKLKNAAKTIAEQSHRLSQIITDLMEFAKPVPPRPTETDLPELLDRALYDAQILCEPKERRVEITMGELPAVLIDPEQVKTAFVQILHNALQATDEKAGEITIHAAYDAFSSRVVVNVADNGRGMDEETLKRAFDPFFSSLPAGRRRGLGLAKALRWIEGSGGSIKLESKIGKGTRAMVLLPAAWSAEAVAVERERKVVGE